MWGVQRTVLNGRGNKYNQHIYIIGLSIFFLTDFSSLIDLQLWLQFQVADPVFVVLYKEKHTIIVAIMISLSDYTHQDYFDAYKLEMVLKLNFK